MKCTSIAQSIYLLSLSLLFVASIHCTDQPATTFDSPELAQTISILQMSDPNITREDTQKLLSEKVDPYLRKTVAEYHPKFPFAWRLASTDWITAQDGPNDRVIGVPTSAIIEIENDGKLSDSSRGVLMHELTHAIKGHSQLKKDFYEKNKPWLYSFVRSIPFIRLLSPLLFAGFHQKFEKFCQNCEWEADEGVPNDKDLLGGMRTYFKRKKEFEKFTPVNAPKPRYQTHPTHEAREYRFAQRLDKLTAGDHLGKPHVRTFFGPDLLPKPIELYVPGEEILRPREKAQKLGIDSDYYPTYQLPQLPSK